jgi:Response regulator containing CheY-like receiver, AAA-type ATPase, and DNA-binding domains
MTLDKVLAILLDAKAMAQSIGSPPGESLADRAAMAGRRATPDPNSPRVLVVDDNAIVRTVCGNIVKTAGFMPDFAVDGVEAVEKCRASAYNFVLMDMLMPEMDGDEAAKAIKHLPPPFGTVRIIAMSGTDSDAMRQKARESGMDDFISKPFTFEQLKSALGCLC